MSEDDWARPVFRALGGKHYDTQKEAKEASKKQYLQTRFFHLLNLAGSSIVPEAIGHDHAEWFIENVERILEDYDQVINEIDRQLGVKP